MRFPDCMGTSRPVRDGFDSVVQGMNVRAPSEPAWRSRTTAEAIVAGRTTPRLACLRGYHVQILRSGGLGRGLVDCVRALLCRLSDIASIRWSTRSTLFDAALSSPMRS